MTNDYGGHRLAVRTPDCDSGNMDSNSIGHPKRGRMYLYIFQLYKWLLSNNNIDKVYIDILSETPCLIGATSDFVLGGVPVQYFIDELNKYNAGQASRIFHLP